MEEKVTKNLMGKLRQPIHIDYISMYILRESIEKTKEIIDKLPLYGATLEDTMKKDIFVLIVKSKDDETSKTKYAVEHNIPIMTPDEFISTFVKGGAKA